VEQRDHGQRGIVSVIGGPLPTGRRRAIDQVIRTTAPMHDGFSGGAFLDTAGGLIGIATAAAIRGLGVVIPAAIAWKTAATVLEHGSLKRGYLGSPASRSRCPRASGRGRARAGAAGRRRDRGSPARRPAARRRRAARVRRPSVEAPEELLDLLLGDRVGKTVALKVLRGGARRLDRGGRAERRSDCSLSSID
jgi:S1-C subfamily serine protease